MKINKFILTMAASTSLVVSSYAQNKPQKMTDKKSVNTVHKFEVEADRFADLQVLRYEIEGFDELTPKQKELAYYLFEAANSGRDIIYDQKYSRSCLDKQHQPPGHYRRPGTPLRCQRKPP